MFLVDDDQPETLERANTALRAPMAICTEPRLIFRQAESRWEVSSCRSGGSRTLP